MNSMAARAFIGLFLTGYAADFCVFDGTIDDNEGSGKNLITFQVISALPQG
jgi:hypothetical protein